MKLQSTNTKFWHNVDYLEIVNNIFIAKQIQRKTQLFIRLEIGLL